MKSKSYLTEFLSNNFSEFYKVIVDVVWYTFGIGLILTEAIVIGLILVTITLGLVIFVLT